MLLSSYNVVCCNNVMSFSLEDKSKVLLRKNTKSIKISKSKHVKTMDITKPIVTEEEKTVDEVEARSEE